MGKELFGSSEQDKWVMNLVGLQFVCILALLGGHVDVSGEGSHVGVESGAYESGDIHTHQLEVDGASVPLTDMGPVIINKDGTTRRISNWKILNKHEQERTWVRIKKRNTERLAVLKAQEDEAGDASEPESDVLPAVVPALLSGTEDEEDLLAALAEIDALGLGLEDSTPRVPSMFK